MSIIGLMILAMALGLRKQFTPRARTVTLILISLVQVALVLYTVFTASPPSGS